MNAAATVPVICIDGPSGVGKGTLARGVALHFGFDLLDSGSLYRLTALSALNAGLNLTSDDEQLASIAAELPVEFIVSEGHIRIVLAGQDVTTEIREERVGNAASQVAAKPSVRAALLQRQRDFAVAPGLVADGRDMGTVVFPEAPVKIFLKASAEVRAQRRFDQLHGQPEHTRPDTKALQKQEKSAIFRRIFDDIVARDHRDATRSVAPLKAADDAVVIDTSSMTIDDVLAQAIALAARSLSSKLV